MVSNIAGWIIVGTAALAIFAVGGYGEMRDRRFRKDIIAHGEQALAKITKFTAYPGRNSFWGVTVEFQAIDHEELTRLEFRVPTGPQMAVWGDWKTFLGQPKSLDDFEVGQLVEIHYPKKWPGLAVLDSRPNATRIA